MGMSDNESTAYFNASTSKCEVCSFTSVWATLIWTSVMLNLILTVPCGSWAVWLLTRGSLAALEVELFLLHLFCTDIACVCLTAFSVLNYYVTCKPYKGGIILSQLCLHGLPLFQGFLCVERYLAVVHPVIFLKYKPLRYKAACLCLAWLVVGILEAMHYFIYSLVTYLIIFVPVVCTELFCSLSILRVLNRPCPGDPTGDPTGTRESKKEGNLMKKKAFIIISLLLVKLLMNYMPIIGACAIKLSFSILTNDCTVYAMIKVNCFFGSFIQPLLYLHRAGKLPFIRVLIK